MLCGLMEIFIVIWFRKCFVVLYCSCSVHQLLDWEHGQNFCLHNCLSMLAKVFVKANATFANLKEIKKRFCISGVLNCDTWDMSCREVTVRLLQEPIQSQKNTTGLCKWKILTTQQQTVVFTLIRPAGRNVFHCLLQRSVHLKLRCLSNNM